MVDHEPRPIDPRELGVDENVQFNQDLRFLPRDAKGRIRWKALNRNPKELQFILRNIASGFVSEGHSLTQSSLKREALGGVVSAITNFYPGGLSRLQNDLGFGPTNPSEHVHIELGKDGLPRSKSGKIWWSHLARDPKQMQQVLEDEANSFMVAGNHLTQENLKVARMSGFGRAIQQYYPGGIEALREKVGESLKSEQRPQDYWQPETIREEARQFYESIGILSFHQFVKYKRADLGNAIKKYPGGMKQLKKDLGITTSRKPEGYWTPQNIEQESRIILEREGDINTTLLRRLKLPYLAHAIFSKYPGCMKQLRINLGIDVSKDNKTKGYWTPRTIEQEAFKIYEETAILSRKLLIDLERGDLLMAISTKYPGGMKALKAKLTGNTDDLLLQEYEGMLLSGQIMSYEEFMNIKEGQV